MSKTSTALLCLLALSTLSMWGCTQRTNGTAAARIRDLEARYAKLEEDYRVVIAAGEANRRKIAALETQRHQLEQKVQELQVVTQERDQLREQLAARTAERDQVHGQLVQFGRDLQSLVGRVETAAASLPGAPLADAVPASRSQE